MERARYNRHSRVRVAETAKDASSMQRRTRRSTSTMGGAAPDTIIGRADAERAGARPFRATGAKARRSRSRARAAAGRPMLKTSGAARSQEAQ